MISHAGIRSLARRTLVTGVTATLVALGVGPVAANAGSQPGTSDPNVTFDVPDTVPVGAGIELRGTGWLTTDGSAGSAIAVKLDDGGVSTTQTVTNPVSGAIVANKTIVAVAAADSTGVWSLTVPLPTPQNSTVASAWKAGERHSVRLLSGSLRTGDKVRTESASFTLTDPTAQAVAPAITTEPISASVAAGSSASFTATVTGTPAPALQWQRQTLGGSWTDVADASSVTLALTGTTVAQSGTRYRLKATNSAGSITSAEAVLTEVSLTLDATSYAPGATVTVTGAGYRTPDGKGGSYVVLKGDDGKFAFAGYGGTDAVAPGVASSPTFVASADGTFTGTVTLPADLAVVGPGTGSRDGQHWLRALSGSFGNPMPATSTQWYFGVGNAADPCADSVQAAGSGATVCVQRNVSSTKAGTIRVVGSGWTTGSGTASTVVVKLSSRTSPSAADFSFVHTGAAGDPVLDHPVNGNADPTIWAIVHAHADGTLNTAVPVPAEANVPAGVNDGGLRAGRKLVVRLQSGVVSGDTVRSVVTPSLVVDGIAYPGDKDSATTSCTAPSAAFTATVQPPDGSTATMAGGPTVFWGHPLRVVGTGWCNSDPSKGGSVIGVKIDDGAYSHRTAETVTANAQVWALISVDSADGSFDTTITLPAAGDVAGGSIPALSSGVHTLRLLTGSLKAGDPVRTLQTGPFTVGAYTPNGIPDPVDYREDLTAASRHGVTLTRSTSRVLVHVPGATEGDWIFLTAYLSTDGSPRYPWADHWFQVDAHGTVTASLSGATLPVGASKVTAQSDSGKLLGWAALTVAAVPSGPSGSGAGSSGPSRSPDADPSGSSAGSGGYSGPAGSSDPADSSGAPVTAGGSVAGPVIVSAGDGAFRPSGTPAAPVPTGAGLTTANAGTLTAVQDGGLVTITVPGTAPGSWVFVYLYSDPTPVGWAQLDAGGRVTVDVSGMPAGIHRIAVLDRAGTLLGWVPASVAATGSVDSPVAAVQPAARTAPATASAVVRDDEGLDPDTWLLIAAGLLAAGALGWLAGARARRPATGTTKPSKVLP